MCILSNSVVGNAGIKVRKNTDSWILSYKMYIYLGINVYLSSVLGSRDSSVVDCWTRDRKVLGLSPGWSSGRIFFSWVNFLCWTLLRYPIHPHVTAVACKRSCSFCQKCSGRLQLNTHAPMHVAGCTVYTEHACVGVLFVSMCASLFWLRFSSLLCSGLCAPVWRNST